LRGEDRQYAFRPGRAFRPRVTDSRSITLGLWLIGQDGPGTTTADYMDNYAAAERELRRLLRPDGGAEFEISKTWTDDLGTHTATGHGIAGTIERKRAGKHAGRVTVDIGMADPFFYGSTITVPLTKGVPATVTNPGDEGTVSVELDLIGQLANPVVTNSTPDPDIYVKVGTAIAVGDTVRLNADLATVSRDSDGANLIGALTHSGNRAWLRLGRGANVLTLSADSGAGSAVLRYLPVYYSEERPQWLDSMPTCRGQNWPLIRTGPNGLSTLPAPLAPR
jgi:hypothetical protein